MTAEWSAMLNARDLLDREAARRERKSEDAIVRRYLTWRDAPHTFRPEQLTPQFCYLCGRNKRIHEGESDDDAGTA